MHRLNGEDAGFLHLEQPDQPMHVVAVLVLRPGRDTAGPLPLTRQALRDHLAARLEGVPALRWRILEVPLRLHHPVCVEDPAFDVDAHVRELSLPPEDGPHALDRFVGAYFEDPLPRHRPLWEAMLVDGLPDGRRAVALKFHHCLMDGTATIAALGRLCAAQAPPAGASPWRGELLPTRRRLVADALRDHTRTLRRLPRLVVTSARRVSAAERDLKRSGRSMPRAPKDVPPSLFNDAFGRGRTCIRTFLPLEDMKRVKDARRVSLNDVALAVMAGAFRRYLLARDALPDRPLVAGVPVAFEPPDAPVRVAGNRFTTMATSLATHVADPLERLADIHAVAETAKRYVDLSGPELLPDWLEMFPPWMAAPAARRHRRRRRLHRDRVDLTATISNVRGPARPWSLGSATVEEVHFAGPPNNGVGSVTAFFSYGGTFMVCVLAVTDALEAPDELRAHIDDALAELVAASGTQGPAPTPKHLAS